MVGDRGAEQLHLLPTFVDHGGEPAPEPGRGPPRRARRCRAHAGRRPRLVHAVAHRGGRAARGRADAARDRVRVLPRRAATRPSSSASRRGCGSPTSTERRDAARASRNGTLDALSDDDLDVLGYDSWLAGLEAGLAAHHAGMVPPMKEAVEEAFAAGLAQGRVRDRDAVARHQHAGPLGGHREAVEVHRRAPRVPDAGRVHAARGARRPARHRRPSATSSCSGTRSWRSNRSPGSRRGARTRSRRRSARRTTWPRTSCSGIRPSRPATCSTCRSRSSTPIATSCRSSASSNAPRSSSRGARRRAADPGGDVQRVPAARSPTSTRRKRDRARPTRRRGSTRSGPATSCSRRARGGKVVVLKQDRGRAGNRVLALTAGATSCGSAPNDFRGPVRKVATIDLPRPFAPRSQAFQRAAADALRRLTIDDSAARRRRSRHATSQISKPGCAPTRCTTLPGLAPRAAGRGPGRPHRTRGRAPRTPRRDPQRQPGPAVRSGPRRARGLGLPRRLGPQPGGRAARPAEHRG